MSNWRAFPSADKVKVWIEDSDPAWNALRLYQPQTRIAKMAKSIVSNGVDAFIPFVMKDRPDLETKERLEFVDNTIQDLFKMPALTISISPSTNGIFYKLTAQISVPGWPIAYAKVSNEPKVIKLLENEADMLCWLQQENYESFTTPEFISIEMKDGFTFMFQDTPTVSSMPRPVNIDKKDIAFLTDMMKLNRMNESLDDFFNTNVELMKSFPGAKDVLNVLFSSGKIELSAAHGDYASWNSLELKDGQLYVFDWEFAHMSPLFTDMFHRVLRPEQLLFNKSPKETVHKLLSLWDDQDLAPIIKNSGVSKVEFPGYLMLYLMSWMNHDKSPTDEQFIFFRESLDNCLSIIDGDNNV